jgi:hypothetical protein
VTVGAVIFRRGMWAVVAGLGLAVAGCSALLDLEGDFARDAGAEDVGPPDTAEPDGSDAASVEDVCFDPVPLGVNPSGCAGGYTYTYVVSVLDFAVTDAITGQTPGFNLDWCNTTDGGNTGCGHMDRSYDVDQNGTLEGPELGVDSQLSEVAGILGGFLPLQSAVDDGELLLLVVISGVHDLQDDSCVEVTLLRGEVPEGVTLEHDSNGRIAPGQAFAVDPASYDATGEPLQRAQGVVRNGRLFMELTTFLLAIAVDDGVEFRITLHEAQAAFELSAAQLSVGVVAGSLDVDTFSDSVGSFWPEFPPETVRSFVEPLADLNPDEDNANCDQISAGLVFAAVDAEMYVLE